MNISVIGLGYIGLPTAIILALNGHDVKGFDISREVVKKLNEGHIHIVEKGLQDVFETVLKTEKFKVYDSLQESDAYIISVPTPFEEECNEKKADLSYVESAANLVAEKLKKDDLVILESTVPPTATRKMTDILEKKSGLAREEFYTVHCPERVLPGNIMYEMEHNDRIIGAEREESAIRAQALYETFLKGGKVYLTDDITAEMCKLVENSYRDVNIAFANELSIICDKLDINVKDLISLANKHPRVNILSPGVGVGGHCLAVDPYFIIDAFKEEAKLIGIARKVNNMKPSYIAEKVEKILEKNKRKKITILGMSYKPDIDDFRESPSVDLAKNLKDKGYKVRGCDPNAGIDVLEGIEMISLNEALQDSDLIVVAQKHREFIEREKEILNTAHLCV